MPLKWMDSRIETEGKNVIPTIRKDHVCEKPEELEHTEVYGTQQDACQSLEGIS